MAGSRPAAVPSLDEEKMEHIRKDVEDADNDDGGVNVERAHQQFEELRRQLSRASSMQRTQDGQKDVEKEGRSSSEPQSELADDDEVFDLLDYLRTVSAKNDDAGIKHKHVGVTFKDLTVIGGGGLKIFIRTFPDAIKEFVLYPLILFGQTFKLKPFVPQPKTILHNFHGTAKPGEMVLVLGRPNAGCSTFLKTVANQRGGFLSVEGDVRYAGLEAKEFDRKYKGELVYNDEDDYHLPTLTVAQTLLFALQLKTPGKRLPNMSGKEFNETVLDTFLKMLNIQHTRNTVVGNAFVRGVSGGERKRVSIAEMMATRASVLSWDNTTKGLDASTALDYAKSLRIITDIYRQTTFVSLYQAGEGIYECFDKVLVIDEGRQVYFGPVKEARQYFIGLGYRDMPRQTTADYLTGCTDPHERRFANGRDASNVPSTPEQLDEVYRKSDVFKRMSEETEAYLTEMEHDHAVREEFRLAVKEDKNKFVHKKSPYTVSFFTQVWALLLRQLRLQLQNPFDIFVSFGTAIGIALIAGTCYFKLPQTAAGAFTRGGVLFIALLFNALTAFNELPTQMQGRPILYKQQNFCFYRPSALAFAMMLADIPLTITKIFIFTVIIYFMAGLVYSAGAFFTAFLLIYFGYLAMSAFFRSLGVITVNYDVAARLASVLITAMVLYAGYVVPRFAQKRWLFWIGYLDPVQYGFAGLMENELGRLNLACVGPYLAPRNPPGLTKYPDTLGPNQVCTLAGSTPGNPIVPGRDYLQAAFGWSAGDVWLNFGVEVIFFAGFQLITMILIEVFAHGANHMAIMVYKKEDKETKKLNQRLQERKEAFKSGKLDQDLSGLIKTRRPFTFSHMNYTVPVPGGQKRLLHDVSGYVKPGSITALMGASGAGKTTLLDVLAQRKSIGVITGDLLVAGRPIGRDFTRSTAYVEQLDVHCPTATVREALRFSAYLRQPYSVSKEEKDAYCEEILEILELQDLADAQIGYGSGFGLGVEARKRLTIGVELAAKPQLLLFLDEPTSGLDGQSAYAIVYFLRKLAAAGQAILCTIHQPNALLLSQFDRLLLLQRGGDVVYFGDVGEDAKDLIKYFADHGAVCPPNVNPAEYMLDAIGAGSQKRVGSRDWADVYRDSELYKQNLAEIERINTEALQTKLEIDPDQEREYATPLWYQLKVVVQRTLVSFDRMPDYGFTRLYAHIAIALFTGLTFLNLGNSTADLQYKVFTIFMSTIMPALVLAQVEPRYIMDRMVFLREDASKMYTQLVFGIAEIISETPYSIICALAFWILYYYPAHFNFESGRAGYAFAMILVTELYGVTLAQAISACTPSMYIAAMLNPFMLIILSLFCGVTIPKPNLPRFWRVWLYPLNPFTRLISGLISTELHGLEVVCKPSEFSVFQPPSGQTCTKWAGEFVDAYGGYLNNPNATTDCQYCQYKSGDEFYSPLGISFDERGRDIGIFICYVAFNIIVVLVACKFIKWGRR